jgi:CelD/BcsL family acetyltransferase involved in cellulose biosynthesis
MPHSETALPLRIGARTLFRFKRRLVKVSVPLEAALSSTLPDLPPLERQDDGYLIKALAADRLPQVAAARPELKPFVRQLYRRSYVRLDQDFDAYLAAFPGKRRSTLLRKVRRLEKVAGGALDIRSYRSEAEIETFHAEAGQLSAKTYQERLLDAGLPTGPEALAEMRALARRDAVRAWLLFLDGRPISYLYAPAEGATLIYAYLGYDPAFAEHSPGAVLQLEAQRQLMGERKFRLFDFTEGEGQHKRQFASGDLECLDLLLLRPTLRNLTAGHGLAAFDAGVALAKRIVTSAGGADALRRLRR